MKKTVTFDTNYEFEGEIQVGDPNISHYPEENNVIVNREEIIEGKQSITISFDYPLRSEITIPFTTNNKDGFTKDEFVKCVRRGYEMIYASERATITNGKHEGLNLHPRESDGIFGIWGHQLYDLFLEEATQETPGVWVLTVGS